MTETKENQFQRTPQDIQLRKEREEAYKRLRPLNESATNRYSKKAREDNDDPFDDILGGGGDIIDEGPKIKVKSSNVKDIMRATKACYQKLSSLTRETKEATLQAILSVKLNKFMEEAVKSLISAKFQLVDVPAFVEIISTLHQLYKEFLPLAGPMILRQCDNHELSAAQRRNYVCLVADLLIARVFTNPNPILHLFTRLVNYDLSDNKFSNFKMIWELIKWAGGDLFGISRGQETIIDCVFLKDPPGTTNLKKEIVRYFKALIAAIEQKCEEGRENYEKAYELIVKLGSINSGFMQQGKENRKEYDELLSKAKCIGFVVNKEVPDPWVENEEMTEITTIDGPIKVPTRLIPETPEGVPVQQQLSGTDNFYDLLADMNVKLAEPLGFGVSQIKIEVDHAKDSARIDTLARHYALIDKPEDRQQLIQAFSSIGKNRGSQAKYYARFIADVSQLYEEVGKTVAENIKNEYVDFINYACSDAGASSTPKLHVARYMAELAHFRIGIEQFFDCINYTLAHFRPRTAEMVCTLINISGKFFNKLCDQTHTNIQNVLSEMEKKKPEIATHQYAIMMVEQTINSINPPETAEPMYYINSYNEYQAFITYIFHSQIEQENFPAKARRIIEKLLQQSEKTKVTMKFITNLALDLSNYSGAQLPNLAKFIAEFTKVYPAFGMQIADICCERVRRFLECPNPNYKQRLIMEARFIAELARPDVSVIPVETAMIFANFILTFNATELSKSKFIKIQRPGAKRIDVNQNNRDFNRIFVVSRMIETLIPAFKKDICIPQLAKLMTHIQIYAVFRFPIPANVAFRISEIFDTLNFECKKIMDQIPRIETREAAENYKDISNLQKDYTFQFLKKATTATRGRLDLSSMRKEFEEEEEEEDNSDDLYEDKFTRELEEFTEYLDKERKSKATKHEKVTIPLSLMSSDSVIAAPLINSKTGPIGDFEVYTSKGESILIKPDAKPESK